MGVYEDRQANIAKLAARLSTFSDTGHAATELGFPTHTAINEAVRPILARYAAQMVCTLVGDDAVFAQLVKDWTK